MTRSRPAGSAERRSGAEPWGALADQLADRLAGCRVALVLGGVDTGKTTLVRALNARLGGEVVDADLGQAEIGPPTVISLGTYQHGARAGYFVGDISPRGHFLPVLVGIARLVACAARPCLIDTDGYVDDGAARAYKTELVNVLRPDALVLLQRRGELDYFRLYQHKGIDVVEVPVEHGGIKLREERVRTRQALLRRYFADAVRRPLSFRDVRFERAWLGHGEPLDAAALARGLGCPVVAAWRSGTTAVVLARGLARPPGGAVLPSGVEAIKLIPSVEVEDLLVGCLRGDELLGLGIVKAVTSEGVEVLTPVEQPTVLQAGAVRVRPDGSHERVRGDLL
jgi:polynucleotide 5'-hydroxyl-kinase GRC3/NOL9